MYRRQYRIAPAGNSGPRASGNDENEANGHLPEQFDNTPQRPFSNCPVVPAEAGTYVYRRQYRIAPAGNSGSRASGNNESEANGHLPEQFDNTPQSLLTFHRLGILAQARHSGASRNLIAFAAIPP